jgi:GDP-L-fucose synthase|tara:strand:+ start:3265 stop:4152 length:888 start_codon:yes stop_codon:yes gene_type:complete
MRIVVTGGSGLVGKHLQEILPDAFYLSSKDCDLTDIKKVRWMISSYTPDVVVHLAAKVGGIQDNLKYPADYFDDNVLINTNIVKVCKEYNVKRFIGILSTCIYPSVVDNYPMTEEDLFIGPPPPSNFSYGYAKRCLAVQIDAYNKQFNTEYNYLIPCNLYGDYDNLHNENKMHFITALLNKIRKSQDNSLHLLGTGKPLRQFMYAGDLAKIIKKVIDNNITESFNVAPDFNYSINEMAEMALEVTNKKYNIIYSKPELDGQFRKDVSNKKLRNIFPDFKFTDLKTGIKQVYDKIS